MTNTTDQTTSKVRLKKRIHGLLYPLVVRPRENGQSETDTLERIFAQNHQSSVAESIVQPTVFSKSTLYSKLPRLQLLIHNSKLLSHSRRSWKRLSKYVGLISNGTIKFFKKLFHHPLQTFRLVAETVVLKFKQYWTAQPGELSWSYLFMIGRKNIMRSFSRTAVTVGAIAAGSAAIVVLVGFAYGLESIVTKRLVQPNSLRLADVQSTSTAYQIDKPAIEQLSQIAGVENVSMSVNLAGSVKYGDAQTEVVVVGARNDFLDASHIELVAGEFFSEDAEMAYTGEVLDLSQLATAGAGVVAGTSIEAEPIAGERVSDQPASFRINDEVYVPLRAEPNTESSIVGYVRGSILERHQGYRVWGGVYDSVGTAGRAYQLSSGNWLGEWLKIEQAVPLYMQQAPTVFAPIVEAEGKQKLGVGYLSQNSVSVLSAQEALVEKALETLSQKSNLISGTAQVLGESTVSGDLSESVNDESAVSARANNLVGVVLDQTATSSASEQQLLESMIAQSQTSGSTASATLAVASVAKRGGKEILVSTGFLNALKLSPESVVGNNLSVQYILSGGLVSGMKGKVTSEATEYTIVGVFDLEEQSMVFAPLSDLESMGVSKYSLAKVLADNPEALEAVRERIGALGFRTRSIADTLLQVNKLFSIMRFLLGSFGMIAFIVALFGMFNTLTVSLLERTREIGVMKTLGTTDRDIRRLLIVESSLIGAAGGVLGVLFGVVLGNSLNWISMLSRSDKTLSLFQFPILFLLFVFLLAALVGMLTGLYPARRAHKISALNALRYE